MLFNSIPFLVFIILFFAIWPLACKNNTSKWLWICAMSFLFYAWWDWRFLFLLLLTGAVDYLSGKAIVLSKKHKFKWLWFSLITNIASLFIFKYSFWLAGVLDSVFSYFNTHSEFQNHLPQFSLVLPIGISFYTFNSMSYTIDLYRGKTKPAENILHFFAFISFFPHLVAGPIIRARDILSQLTKPFTSNYLQVYNGLQLCIWGLFQKMVLADNLAVLVNNYFKDSNTYLGSINWLVCMLCFSFQIYFDFNGYSTIARGIAKLCGIHFKLNFNHPYIAHSFSNFWQRWHISLSSFFRDYVYIPLGGNRKGKFRNKINLMFTFLVSGLWHGANLTFLIWGALHGFYLLIERSLKLKVNFFLAKPIAIMLVFMGVLFAWVFFRAQNIDEAIFILKEIWRFKSTENLKGVLINVTTFWLFIGILSEFLILNKTTKRILNYSILQPIISAILVILILFFRGPEQQFIYFQF